MYQQFCSAQKSDHQQEVWEILLCALGMYMTLLVEMEYFISNEIGIAVMDNVDFLSYRKI